MFVVSGSEDGQVRTLTLTLTLDNTTALFHANSSCTRSRRTPAWWNRALDHGCAIVALMLRSTQPDASGRSPHVAVAARLGWCGSARHPPTASRQQVYLWNSKHCHPQTSRSSVGGTCSSGVGAGIGAGAGAGAAAAGPSCPASSAAAVAPAPAPATRVKSRTSSSFSVQCATTPKVATAAVFFPPAALDAVCRAAAGGAGGPAAAAAPAAADAGGDKLGKGAAKGWRGGMHRSPSPPRPETAVTGDGPHAEAAAVGNGGDDGIGGGGGGAVRRNRRRWSFTGQALFGTKAQPQHVSPRI